MARKTKFTRDEWRRIFRAAVHYCRSEGKKEYGGYRECMSKVLKKASELGKVPEELEKYY